MSKSTRTFCDRCKAEIFEQPDYMQAPSSMYRISEVRVYGHIGRGEIDLCTACQKKLTEWLRGESHEDDE